ncbi:MAG: ABC transporter ATP-binding protein [Acholeplasmatales bacterium]|nr:ABC transporter ATP-binding protein [Acholeplasmatales bacterium]
MFAFIKSMWWFVKKQWYRYIAIVVVGILLTLINLVPPIIIARLTTGVDQNTITEQFLLYDVLIPFVITIFAIYITATTKRVLQNRLKVKLYYALQVKYMENILIQDATFFERFQSGDLLTRALGDVKAVNFSGGNRLLNIFLETMTVVVTFIAMCFINWKLAVCCFIPLSLIFFANFFLRRKVKKNWKLVREKSSLMGNVILESVTNVRTIRAFSKEEENYEKNLKYSNDAYIVEKKNLKLNVLFQPMFQSIVAVSTIVCYGLGAYFYSLGLITLPLIVQFVLYLNKFQGPLTNIGNLLNNFYQSLISADRLNEIYDSKSMVVDSEEATDLEKVEKIEFKNFSFKYLGDRDYALKDVDLVINKGKTLGIVGKTGSGKSTLVRQLVRQLPICEGTLFINDKSIESFGQESVRSRVGYVPQEHMLFSRSVMENVAIGLTGASEEEINNAIVLADFEKDIDNLP